MCSLNHWTALCNVRICLLELWERGCTLRMQLRECIFNVPVLLIRLLRTFFVVRCFDFHVICARWAIYIVRSVIECQIIQSAIVAFEHALIVVFVVEMTIFGNVALSAK